MFEAIVEAGRLQSFVDSLTCLVNECKIQVDHSQGFEARAADPANVAMVFAEIDVEAFESFDSGKGVIGLNVNRLDDIISFASAGDLVHLQWNDETRRLDVTITTGGGEFTYDLALIDPGAIRAEPELPDLSEQLTERFTISGGQFDTAIDAVTLCSDHVIIEACVQDVAPRIRFYSEGDTDQSTWTFDGDDCVFIDVDTEKASMFSTDYFEDMSKPIPNDAEVTFRLGEDFPTQWEYEADEGVSVVNMLAPRIGAE